MPDVSIQIEFPSSLHVMVKGAKSERSAVQLSRNFASKHYGTRVGHWVSGGGGTTDGEIYYTYIYSNPSYVDEPLPDLPLNPDAPVIPRTPLDLPLKLTTIPTHLPPKPEPKPKPNHHLRRVQRRSGGAFAALYA